MGLLERGEMSSTLRTVDRLAEALGIPLHDLLREPADQGLSGESASLLVTSSYAG